MIVNTASELEQAVNKVVAGVATVITIATNIRLTETLVIPNNKHITLTSLNKNNFVLVGAVGRDTITVSKDGVLELVSVTVTHENGDGNGILVSYGGTLIMDGDCTIYGNTANSYGYGGNGVVNHGIFILFDGVIADNVGGVYNDGSFTMLGGKIYHNNAAYGGVYNVGSFDMFDGTICDNTAVNGGGIYFGRGSVRLFKGIISGNIASNSGGGVWVDIVYLDKLYVKDNMIFSNNHASKAYNRAPYHDHVYNKTINSNVTWTALFSQGYNNYDISYTSGTPLPFYNVKIENSYAELSGEGRYPQGKTITIRAGIRAGYTFAGWTIKGDVATLLNNSTADFVVPMGDVVITANWTINKKFNVTINDSYAKLSGEGNYPHGITTTVDAGIRTGYTFAGWTVKEGKINLQPVLPKDPVLYTPENTAIFVMPEENVVLTGNWKAILTESKGCTVTVNNSFAKMTGAGIYYKGEKVFIDSGQWTNHIFTGWTINEGSNTIISQLNKPTNSFAMSEENVILTANWVSTEKPTQIIKVSNEAELRQAVSKAVDPIIVVFTANIQLTNSALNIATQKCVTLMSDENADGFFSLIGVSGQNTIIVDPNGVLEIAGVIVTHKKGSGSGVFVSPMGSLTLSGGEISGNTANMGGGVHSWGNFTMHGGTITNNTANSYGGGVHNYGKDFTIYGGTITNNTAENAGGGVHSWGNFTMHGGTITNNTANKDGNVYNSGRFTIFGGTLSGNS